MRIVTPITVIALAGGFALFSGAGGVESISKRLPFGREASLEEVAVEARCGGLEDWRRRSCEEQLSSRFASGEANPDAVLRMHCTRARSVWDQNLPEPPALCAARFGGWLSASG